MHQTAISFTDTRARRYDCDTSKAAAKAAVTRKASGERVAIAEAVEKAAHGLTGREAAARTGIDYITVQRRISECGLTKSQAIRDGCRVWVSV